MTRQILFLEKWPAWDCGVDEGDVEGDYAVPEDHCGVVLCSGGI